MKYIKAQDVLPEDILKMIQEYVDGEYLYVPRKKGNQRYLNGITIPILAEEYYLSEKSIRRIISEQKRQCS